MNHRTVLPLIIVMFACTEKIKFKSYEEYPTPTQVNLWPAYNKSSTSFKLWSPTADKVRLKLFSDGNTGEASTIHALESEDDGLWSIEVGGDLKGTYYTFQVMIDGQWLEETPGIYAQAVGVNGKRAMVIDLASTNPPGWEQDKGPVVRSPNEAILYELHVRDMTIHSSSGSSLPGKYLGLVETGTTGPSGIETGIDHLKALGITHVHLLPSFDYYSVDETKLSIPQFNWGYEPNHYNVPEGSFATDPYQADVRIKEFKTMVKGFHDQGIGVILDVVYNHTGRTENSNFNLETPGYYYRHWEDGRLSDAAACGNETASERAMMQKYMLESVLYWAREYHLDGFRFDLMGIHDIPTMNKIADTLKALNPSMIIYGEGWTAGDSPLPVDQRALKKNIKSMPQLIAFSDDLRDGLKGSVFEDESTGFVNGGVDTEESVKFGIVGAIDHPQIDYKQVNYSDAPWTNDPWQAISYVSCHDNHTLYDKLKVSDPKATEEKIMAMDKLATAIVLTSQGTAFLHAGSEMLRTKKGEHNSYNLPDSINQINWNWKITHNDLYLYYKNLIRLRKEHPAFRMKTGEAVRQHLEFKVSESGLIGYQLEGQPNGDTWKKILVLYNAREQPADFQLTGVWHLAVKGDDFDFEGSKLQQNTVTIPPICMMVLFQK